MTKGNPHVKDVRGLGLLVGVELDIMAGPVVDAAREMGVLAITAGKGDIVRLVPPLVLTDADIDKVSLSVYNTHVVKNESGSCYDWIWFRHSSTVCVALLAGCGGPGCSHCQGLKCKEDLKKMHVTLLL